MSDHEQPKTPPETSTQHPVTPADNATADDPLVSVYPHRRSRKRWIILGSIIVVAAAGTLLEHYLSGFESTDDAQVDVHLYPVSARIPGYVQTVNVGDNQWVEKGSTLVEIDPKDYEVALAKAQATLDSSDAAAKSSNIDVPISSVDSSSQLKFTSSGIKNAEAAIEAAEKQAAAAHARVLESQAENVKAQDDVTRYRLLLTKEEVPKQVYDHAYAAAATDFAAIAAAEADEAAAQQAVQEARGHLTEAQASYQNAEAGPQRVAAKRATALSAVADVHQKQAALEQARLNLEYTRIVAPVTGEVTKKVVVGLNVDPGEQLLTVVPLDQVWITANFKETQLKHMRIGQRATVVLDASGRTYDGHVDSIAGATGPIFSLLPPENATGNYVKIVQRVPVKIVLDPGDNRDHQLRPGMNVEAKVDVR
ncbi:MAG TPA: HlyD family secretion protein [Acidobacteriaceae bacterium]|jgi:membrane fusion protein (multidrug efflux system)|nr:HlyD family secretion protein [Acidobacteriaceae bacterium]